MNFFLKKFNLLIKRLIDIFGSLIAIIIIFPIFILIALLIKFTSKGPIIFKQERLGKDGKIFNILKFRTMIINAEKIGEGIFIKNNEDKRITKAGKFLRTSSLDELPQLWNVFIGNMSIVGPRPPIPYHPYKYEEYNEIQKKRFKMKPGITGLAQITVRNYASWDKRIIIDCEYIDKFSIYLDLKILFNTIRKIILKEDIYNR
jgi:undecaprenyl phosphate N,N'-diacetylbacillosamine 1-phosphate transferase